MRLHTVLLPPSAGPATTAGAGPRPWASPPRSCTTTSPGASCRDGPWFGTVPVLAAAAVTTSTIRLGTLVASPNYRHPVTFAKEAMTLDDLSARPAHARPRRRRHRLRRRGAGRPTLVAGRAHGAVRELRAGARRAAASTRPPTGTRTATTGGGVRAPCPAACSSPASRSPSPPAAPARDALAARFADTWVTNGRAWQRPRRRRRRRRGPRGGAVGRPRRRAAGRPGGTRRRSAACCSPAAPREPWFTCACGRPRPGRPVRHRGRHHRRGAALARPPRALRRAVRRLRGDDAALVS